MPQALSGYRCQFVARSTSALPASLRARRPPRPGAFHPAMPAPRRAAWPVVRPPAGTPVRLRTQQAAGSALRLPDSRFLFRGAPGVRLGGKPRLRGHTLSLFLRGARGFQLRYPPGLDFGRQPGFLGHTACLFLCDALDLCFDRQPGLLGHTAGLFLCGALGFQLRCPPGLDFGRTAGLPRPHGVPPLSTRSISASAAGPGLLGLTARHGFLDHSAFLRLGGAACLERGGTLGFLGRGLSPGLSLGGVDHVTLDQALPRVGQAHGIAPGSPAPHLDGHLRSLAPMVTRSTSSIGGMGRTFVWRAGEPAERKVDGCRRERRPRRTLVQPRQDERERGNRGACRAPHEATLPGVPLISCRQPTTRR